ncbi:MAG TPA: hypothetical protein DSN98_01245 [Thermoplasmata archaeon]|nr:MAG TPA: hypothetical protein DSN98_01245 [Thermoplasmata archaeon]
MKKTILLLGSFIVFLLIAPSTTAIFPSSHQLVGTLASDSNAFFIGKTKISGTFTGYPIEQLINSSIVHDMKAFPLVGASRISNLDSVIVAEDINISSVSSFGELYLKYYDHITRYFDVDITTDNGIVILGMNQGGMTVSSDLSYALTAFLPMEIIPGAATRFFFTAASVPLTMQCSGDLSVLTQFSNTSTIRVINKQGMTLWSGASQNNYLVIGNNRFSVTQQPPVFLFPLDDATSNASLQLSISPADPKDIKIEQLIEDISDTVKKIGGYNTTELMNNTDMFDTIVKTTTFSTNGAMILLRTNDTVTIDESTQRFTSMGFARFSTLDYTSLTSSSGSTIQADCTLIYLGDHFYNPQAKQNADGTAFPYEVLVIWIFALCVLVYIIFFLRPKVSETRNRMISRYALVLHVVLLIIAVLLLDGEINDLFGISAFTALASQGFSMITGVLIFVEVILWVLGYFILAIPMRILVNSGLRLLSIGKGGKGIGKAIGDLSIWVFCRFYLLLFLNIIFSVIHFNGLFPGG